MDVLKAAEAANFNLMDAFHDMSIGAYQVLGRLDDVPLNVPESHSVTYDVGHMLAGMGKNPGNLLGKYAYQSGAVGSYFDAPSDHMATPLLTTAEEREAFADRGVQAINELVQALDMPTIVETLRQVDVYTKDTILPKYGANLPGIKA